MRHGQRALLTTFLVPAALLYAAFVVWPYAQAFYVSLTGWGGLSGEKPFVGLDNYERLLHDGVFWHALKNNLVLLAVLPVSTILLGLFFASMLNVGEERGVRGVRGSRLYQVVYFFPQVLAITIIAVLWQYVYNPRQGLLNGFLQAVGLASDDAPYAWLAEPRTAFWCVLAVLVWSNVGFYVVLFSAAMQAIPRDIYEAALMDGAGRAATFWRITVPLLWETIQVSWIYLAILSLDGFALVNVMTDGGGPDHRTEVAGQTLYTTAFSEFRFGYASAMGVALFLLTMSIALVAFKISKRDTVEYS